MCTVCAILDTVTVRVSFTVGVSIRFTAVISCTVAALDTVMITAVKYTPHIANGIDELSQLPYHEFELEGDWAQVGSWFEDELALGVIVHVIL